MECRKPEEFMEDLDKGLGEGPLTLGIFCTICDAQYELNREACAMAMLTNCTFMEYLRFVQSGKCKNCEDKKSRDMVATSYVPLPPEKYTYECWGSGGK